ncbi:AraC family transcriptional regulator [Steroidobacter sp.]|uniref:AraC family transcriptional regulator n=1 Tax=Steroidobacter sp. TaxID=1978227 RepID=UPI001A365C0C|nr:helix-turn-helix transcriptional regulator [Steroidobacter sp.]MBL8266495.1 helix-turn-helix transcriptional regulator [Steroidobacter sp.]
MKSYCSADHANACQDIPRPVSALSVNFSPGTIDKRHTHRRAQLLYACSGVMSVLTDTDAFVVPPMRALWLPAGTAHEVHYRGRVCLRTLYIEPHATPTLPSYCCVIEVSDLLRALIVEATRVPIEYDVAGRDGDIISLILREITAMPIASPPLPLPADPRLMRICRAILAKPADDASLEDWARSASMSRATLVRLFSRETGMSFIAWRQQARLVEAMSRLDAGHSITRVAFEVGYRSPSTFTALFRRSFGLTPRQYSALPATSRR